MRVNPEIFREYDIRGIVDKDLTEEVVENIGMAVGSTIGEGKIAVGGDIRFSTERFKNALISGLLSTGIDVVDVGIVPTPALFFAIHHLEMAGGVQVTASHNPPQFNGFKVCKGTDSLYGEEIQSLYKTIQSKNYKKGEGNREYKETLETYERFLKDKFKFSRKLKVAMDCGNGCAGLIAPKLFRELGVEVIELYCEPDGNFPNHPADPTVPENLNDLVETVRKENLDLGIAYDGDADRLMVVDENGRIIWPDILMVLFYKEILSKYPGMPCLFEVKCSQALWEEIERLGGKPQFCPTGHSIIEAKMKELRVPFAGEMSGHIFFADEYLGFDDGIYASLRVLRILSESGSRLSELLKDVPKYYNTPEIRVGCPDSEKVRVVREITEYFKSRYPCVTVDGVRVIFDDGWGLLRKSNTSPKLILRFEAKTEDKLEEIKGVFLGRLKEYPEVDIELLLEKISKE